VFHSKAAAGPAGESDPCVLCAAPDEDLIEQVRQGCQNAIEHFFDRHYSLVFRVALRIVRDQGEAQDIAQEVFFQVIRNLHLYDPRKGAPRTWILAAAYHRSLDRRQYLNLRRFYDQVEIDPFDERIRADVYRPYEPPSLIAEQGLDAALLRLTPPQRETLRLYCFESLTLREIASRRKETLSNTRHHYYRGIEKIREYLVQSAGLSKPALESQTENGRRLTAREKL
jgi:RNA polymerase sigma-70 factor (ECF subfamily)